MTANVRFVAGESSIVPVVSGTWTSHLQVTTGRVEGVLTRPGGAVAPVSCDAYSVHDRFVRAGGAPSTSAAPANDAPAGAIPLTAGKEATVNRTFDAQPGVTYFVQAGGTEADRNFGTLRVAVR